MDRAKILRLLDEADDIVSALYRQGANKDYKCKSLREKLKAIVTEITASPKTNGDRIRQMTDEELAEIVRFVLDCEDCTFHGNNGCSGDCYTGAISWLKKAVKVDD